MNTLIRFLLVVCLVVPLTSCRTLPPRVPRYPEADEAKAEIARGNITLSLPKFSPIYAEPDGDKRLAYGKIRSEEEILNTIRKANMGVSQFVYDSLQMSNALKVAGMQIDASNELGFSGGAGIKPDLSSVGLDPATGEITGGSIPLGLTPEAKLSRNASYKETFKSPGAPESTPAVPTLPPALESQFAALFQKGAAAFQLDPRTEAELIAAYKTYMVSLESYYNLDGLNRDLTDEWGELQTGTDIWQPYLMQFQMTVEPGWFTFLNQYDAVLELSLPDCAADSKFLRAIPQEAAQSLDELSSAWSQLAMASSFEGAMSFMGVRSNVNRMIATARKLEGFRKRTIHTVSYPSDRTIRIKVRPHMAPHEQNAELQPSSILFTATVLIKRDKLSDCDPIKLMETQSGLAFQPIVIPYKAYFEPALMLRHKRLSLVRQVYYYPPKKNAERIYVAPAGSNCSLDSHPKDQCNCMTRTALLPPFDFQSRNQFGFVGQPFGYYYMANEAGKLNASISFAISNPQNAEVVLSTDVGIPGSVSFASGKSIVGIHELTDVPPQTGIDPKKDKIRVMLMIQQRGQQERTEVIEVILPHRDAVPSSPGPSTNIVIDGNGVKTDKLPLGKLDAATISALLGNTTVINTVTKEVEKKPTAADK